MNIDINRSDVVRNYFYRSYRVVRIWMVIALALYTLFGVLDDYLLPFSKYNVWVIRYLIAVPIMAALILFSFLVKENSKHFQIIVILFVTAGTIGLCAMIAMVQQDEKAFYLYFIGLLAIISWCQIIGLTHQLFIVTSINIMIAYNLVAVFANNLHILDPAVYVFNNLFFIVFIAFGFYSTRVNEKFIIDDFFHANELKLDKELLLEKQTELAEVNEFKTKLLSTIALQMHGYLPLLKQKIGKENIKSSGLYESTVDPQNNLELFDLLIETTILWSKKKWHLYPMNDQLHDLQQCIDNSIQSFTEYAKRKEILLQSKPECSSKIICDNKVLDIILRNLIYHLLSKFKIETVTIASNRTLDGIEIIISTEKINWADIHHLIKSGNFSMLEQNNDYNFGVKVTLELIQQQKGILYVVKTENGINYYLIIPQPASE